MNRAYSPNQISFRISDIWLIDLRAANAVADTLNSPAGQDPLTFCCPFPGWKSRRRCRCAIEPVVGGGVGIRELAMAGGVSCGGADIRPTALQVWCALNLVGLIRST